MPTGKPILALVTFLPLAWLVIVTFTAGAEKIFHPDPMIGFLAQARSLDDKLPALQTALEAAKASQDDSAIGNAEKAVHGNRALRVNDFIDTTVTGAFLVMVSAIVLISVWEWLLLLARKRLATLHESDAVWLPGYAVAEGRPVPVLGVAALVIGLARELSGEAQLEHAHKQAGLCEHTCDKKASEQIYLETTEARFKGIRRCC